MKWLVLALVLLRAGGADAQDAVTTVPGSYTRQFENDWVRVVRVHYAPHATLPTHTHPARACAYVYLNDSGPVLFKHAGDDARVVTRPPTKAGAFRLFRGVEESHGVENTSDLPSDFLRVEFKTDPKAPMTLRGKFFRETPPPGESVEKVQFENVQVRVTRLVIAAGRQLDVRTTAQEPSLLIAVTAGGTLSLGQERWFDTNASESIRNAGTEPIELLRFDFKTAPIRDVRAPRD